MTGTKMLHQVLAWCANISKHTDINAPAAYHKTIRVRRVMKFLKCCYHQLANIHRFLGAV
jgi:hypothetical protein